MSSKASSKEEEEGQETGPDGGYGWVVMFAGLCMTMLCAGTLLSYGVFYEDFSERYVVSSTLCSAIGSVQSGMSLLPGLINSILIKKWGCWSVAVAGSLLTAVAIGISSFAPNAYVLLVTFGAVAGYGMNMMFLSNIVAVGQFFTKKRALATGFVVAGAGIGNATMSPLIRLCISEFGGAGALWIVSGLLLNGIVCGLLYRPSPQTASTTKKKQVQFQAPTSVKIRRLTTIDENNEMRVFTLSKGLNTPQPKEIKMSETRRATEFCRRATQFGKNIRGRLASVKLRSMSLPYNLKSIQRKPSSIRKISVVGLDIHEAYACLGRMRRRGAIAKDTDGRPPRLRDLFDCSLLMDPLMMFYGFAACLFSLTNSIPGVYMLNVAKEIEIPASKAAFLLTIIGIVNTISRVASGWLADFPFIDPLLLTGAMAALGGLATTLSPFCNSFLLLCVYCGVYGLCGGVYTSLRTTVMVDIFGEERLASAVGFAMLWQGVGALAGTPTAGSVIDKTNSYYFALHLFGSIMCFAAVLMFLIRPFARWQQKRKEAKQNTEDAE